MYALTGIPGESETDVDEYIKNISKLAKYINQIHIANDLELINGVYFYNHSEKFNIEFKIQKDEITKKFIRTIPNDLWYCKDPYLDTSIAQKRLLRIANEFKKHRIPLTTGVDLPKNDLSNKPHAQLHQ